MNRDDLEKFTTAQLKDRARAFVIRCEFPRGRDLAMRLAVAITTRDGIIDFLLEYENER